MTKIKTAQAWGPAVKRSGSVSVTPMCASPKGSLVPVVIVHGLTEAEVHEAAALLAKSREVCEWRAWSKGAFVTQYETSCNWAVEQANNVTVGKQDLKFCPSCGRKVEVR